MQYGCFGKSLYQSSHGNWLVGQRFKRILHYENPGFHNEGGHQKKMIVLKQISVKSTDMIITIFPVWSSIINALLRTQINVNFCVVKPGKVHFIAVYSYMGLYSMIYSIVQHCPV